MAAKPTYEELDLRVKELEIKLADAKQPLEKSEEKYRQLSDSLPQIVFETDEKGNLTFMNRVAFDILLYTKEDFEKGLNALQLLIPEDQDRALKNIQRVLKGEKSSGNEYTALTKDGRRYPAMVYSTPVISEGKSVGMRGIVADLTDVKRAQKALRESEQKFRLYFNNAPIGYQSLDENGNFIDVNRTWLRMLGYKREEVTGRWFGDFLHPDNVDLFKTAFPKNKEVHCVISGDEFMLRCKDGSYILADYTFTIARDDHGNFVRTHCMFQDITQRRRAEEELLKAKKMESVGVLAGGIAHDFNNLLSIIIGSLSMAKEDIKQGINISGLLDKMEKASLQARDLTHQLITFSTGGDPVKKEIAVGRFLNESVLQALSNTHIKCDFLISEDLWPVECDEAQLRQVIRNAVDNAVEAMGDDGAIEVWAGNLTETGESSGCERLLQEGKYIKISIHDQGAGITKEDLSMIFDPYFSTKERGTLKGMGLGLAAAYSIIKRHNGHIAAESQVNMGTTIHIYLPAISAKRPGETDAVMPGEARDASPEYVLEQSTIQRVLVMDDEEMIRDLAQQMLTRIGCEVEVAWDGVEAIDLYKEAVASGKPFDLTILDLTNSGGMGGIDTIERLLKIDPHVKAIISSGYSNDPVMGNFKQYGFCGALPKPFTLKQLEKVLGKAMD